tara:strand:- start:44 stop:352 length:309 start_codon:yes stop_codon:yes gene_type:complete
MKGCKIFANENQIVLTRRLQHAFDGDDALPYYRQTTMFGASTTNECWSAIMKSTSLMAGLVCLLCLGEMVQASGELWLKALKRDPRSASIIRGYKHVEPVEL